MLKSPSSTASSTGFSAPKILRSCQPRRRDDDFPLSRCMQQTICLSAVDSEVRFEESARLARGQPGVGDAGDGQPGQHQHSVVADIAADDRRAQILVADPRLSEEEIERGRRDFLKHHDVGRASGQQFCDREVALFGVLVVEPDVEGRERSTRRGRRRLRRRHPSTDPLPHRTFRRGRCGVAAKQPHRSLTTTLPLAVRFSSDAMASPARSSG